MSTLAERWWMIVVRGVAAILFGILTFVRPGMSLLLWKPATFRSRNSLNFSVPRSGANLSSLFLSGLTT